MQIICPECSRKAGGHVHHRAPYCRPAELFPAPARVVLVTDESRKPEPGPARLVPFGRFLNGLLRRAGRQAAPNSGLAS